MSPLFCLLLIGCFMFGPLTIFYCSSKKKRPLRKAGKSCESLLVDRSIMKTATPSKKLVYSKILRPKAVPDKKEDNAPKNKDEKVKILKEDQKKTTGTTAETEKTKEKATPIKPNSKPTPAPAKKEVAKKPADTTKAIDAKKKEHLTEPTQNDTENDTQLSNNTGGRSDKTQSQTSQENLEHDTE